MAADEPSAFLFTYQVRQRIAHRNDNDALRVLQELDKNVKDKELQLLDRQKQTKAMAMKLKQVQDGTTSMVAKKVELFAHDINFNQQIAKQTQVRTEELVRESDTIQENGDAWGVMVTRTEDETKRKVLEITHMVELHKTLARRMGDLVREQQRLGDTIVKNEAERVAAHERCTVARNAARAADYERTNEWEVVTQTCDVKLANVHATAQTRMVAWTTEKSQVEMNLLQEQQRALQQTKHLDEIRHMREVESVAIEALEQQVRIAEEQLESCTIAASTLSSMIDTMRQTKRPFDQLVNEQETQIAAEFHARSQIMVEPIENEIKMFKNESTRLDKVIMDETVVLDKVLSEM